MGRVTLLDVAEICGVSRATVSLVIQDSHRVSTATKTRVRKVLADSGYVYDRRAANMRRQTSFSFGLLLTDVKNPALADLAMHFVESADRNGYVVMAAYSGDSRERQRRILREMTEHRLDGIVLSPAAHTTAEDLLDLRNSGVPHVLVTRRITGYDADYVGPNNTLAGQYIGEHLVELGIRSAAFVGGVSDVSARSERLGGLERALDGELGIATRSYVTNAERSGGVAAVTELLQAGPLPDAIVSYSDAVAFGVISELARQGVAAGTNVAIAAFDNTSEAHFSNPSLTTVDTFMSQVGERAVDTLISRLAGRTDTATELMSPVLHVRRSTSSWKGPVHPGSATQTAT